MKCQPTGPLNARIMIVGEAPGSEEERRGIPFVGSSGDELTRMLHDAGIPRESCYLTNVARVRPPGNDISKFFLDAKGTKPGREILEGLAELRREVESVKPNVIVPMGNVPLWALRDHRGIGSWRGSVLEGNNWARGFKLIPTYHPAAILRQWDWRFIAVHDLRRVRDESEFREIRRPDYHFHIRPAFNDVVDTLRQLISRATTSSNRPLRLAPDLETRGGHIACLGIAWSRLDALCIPFMCVERPAGYWSVDEELIIVKLIRELFTHPNVEIVGQNFLYDNQYIARYWGFAVPVYMDTMLAHHVCWPGLPKGLDFLSSMYCEFHAYWKDDGKTWDSKIPEEVLWNYNCIDCVTTWEASVVLDKTVDKLGLREQFTFQMEVSRVVFKMMLRGVAIDHNLRQQLSQQLLEMVRERHDLVQRLAGETFLGPKGGFSPKKLQTYFYDRLKLPVQRNRKTGKPTCDQDALKELAKVEPLTRRLIYSIVEASSLANSLNVVNTPLGSDRRIRCSYNVAGTITFRFSSSEDAFGSGTNLQNITVGRKSEETGLQLPNLRRLFKPDHGRVIINVDEERADLQIVVWEADDDELKRALKSGLDIHLFNARDIYNLRFTDDDLANPEAVTALKTEFYWKRHAAKEFVHATDYAGKAKTVSKLIGETVHATERLQANWFAKHPKIREWHRRIEYDLMTKREVRNIFGYRIFFFDRLEGLLSDALAWVPQSTVALIINRGMVNISRHCPEVEILLQVHDSLTFQVPLSRFPQILHEIHPHLLIPLPYTDPLTIPVGIQTSTKSWGDVEDYHLEVAEAVRVAA